MKYFTVALAAILIHCGSAQGSVTPINAWRMCDGCSDPQMQQCAIEVAEVHALQTGEHVWVFDFDNWVASKFYLQVTPPGTIIQGNGGQDDQLSQSGLIVAFPQTLSTQEATLSAALFGMVQDIWRPLGWGYHYPACGQSSTTSLAAKVDREVPDATIQSQPAMTFPVSIPPGPFQNSAYDVIGDNPLALQLGQQYQGSAGFLGQVQNWANNFMEANPINVETSLKFVFSDDSFGIWRFNFETGRWEADWSTFQDSDGNRIPHTVNDLPPGTRASFSATDQGENNLQQFLDRATMLGIPITGPGGGGGGPILVRCDVTSNGISCVYRNP